MPKSSPRVSTAATGFGITSAQVSKDPPVVAFGFPSTRFSNNLSGGFSVPSAQPSQDLSGLLRRLDSFKTNYWINKSSPSPQELARHGFYADRFDGFAKCHWCGIRLGQWEVDDDVAVEHFRHSPGCQLAMQNIEQNHGIVNMLRHLLKENEKMKQQIESRSALSQLNAMVECIHKLEKENRLREATKKTDDLQSIYYHCSKCKQSFPSSCAQMFLDHVCRTVGFM